MTRANSYLQDPLLPSLLDRLLDFQPDVSTEPAWSRSQGLSELKESVKRDLEYLMNTRRTWLEVPEGFEEAAQSVLAYGLPELTSVAINNADEREHLRRAVEDAISRFEPRLMDVLVIMREADGESDRKLRLSVNAKLRLDPDPEPVTFDTVVEPTTGQCTIEATL